MFLYSMPALFVFMLIYDAMSKDNTVPDDKITNWTFVALAALLWPITLPCILRKKAIRWHTAHKSEARIA